MTSDEIRSVFLGFFAGKDHEIIPSSSLVPHGDPTLLLTSAGMVQFKPYFLGKAAPPAPRLTSCQKCFRTTDIESVGDPTHLTFFEMLGNFSIGDYFKKEAINWAWEFVIQRLGLSPERLWITIFTDDDESFRIWRDIGIAENRILRFGVEHNFWGPAGNSGPCGPCSEIHYDFGEDIGCGKVSCAPNCDCGRFSEIWNLVFTQYNQDESGHRTPLPKPNIDTGMGLERIAAVVQGKNSVYQTDVFSRLLSRLNELTGRRYGSDNVMDNAMRIVAEHSRGIAFLIGDGVIPSNEGRGYVLRRLLRRAALFGRRLGLDKPFLAEMAKATIEQMGQVYPEIVRRQDFILRVIELEETRFRETLSTGLGVLDMTMVSMRRELIEYFPKFERAFKAALSLGDFIDLSYGIASAAEHFQRDCRAWEHILSIGGRDAVKEVLRPVEDGVRRLSADSLRSIYESTYNPWTGPDFFDKYKQYIRSVLDQINHDVQSVSTTLSGYEAFILHDTYGFPVELTTEIAAEHGLSVDLAGFSREMEKQRERARAAQKFNSGVPKAELAPAAGEVSEVEFVGYHTLKHRSAIAGLWVDSETVGKIEEGQSASVILAATPFYGEMGGQAGDSGEIRGPSGIFAVTNTVRVPPDIIVHQGRVTQGSLTVGEEVEAEVDIERRLDIARNHTATHLLQYALRQVLGSHAQQRGSLVVPERLRFDFSHLAAMARDEIQKVQQVINEKIRQNLKVYCEEVSYQKAVAEGAIALFDEKYGDVVRVVRIGEPPISAELCGGTHVAATGEIGVFIVSGESSIGAGLRRIEAVSGRGAETFVNRQLDAIARIAQSLQTSPDGVEDKVSGLVEELDKERKEKEDLERKLSRKVAESLVSQAEVVDGVTYLAAKVPPSRNEILREMSDVLRERLKSAIIVLGTVYADRPAFIVAVTPDLVARGYNAGEIVKRVAKVTGGGGGGKASLAQAGGKDKDKVDEALRLVRNIVGGMSNAHPGS